MFPMMPGNSSFFDFREDTCVLCFKPSTLPQRLSSITGTLCVLCERTGADFGPVLWVHSSSACCSLSLVSLELNH